MVRSQRQDPPWTRRRFLAGASLAAGAGVGLGLGSWPRAVEAAEEKLLEEATSDYNTIMITERGSVRTMYFVVDGTRYIESRWDMAHPNSLDLDYSRTMMAGFLVNPEPKRFMMMGVGGGQMSNYLFERFPGLEIDAVDIDPEVVRLARKYFGVPDDPRYRTHVGDGRLFIEQAEEPWDMIMLDAFRGVFVPYHLKTREAYEACLAKLRPGGAVVANLHNLTRMYPHDRNTLAAVFPQRYSFVSESGNQTTFVASSSAERVGTYAIREHAREVSTRFDFDIMGLCARYYMRSDWDTDASVLTDDFKPGELETAAERHNTTCIAGCAYPAR
ncbi:fused MFS/spermidine synthase [Pseudenhygromyxa sp. WMMC2535]|uniref:fused MFS/spermidine synthase n=1 Tax=Pseudenhygromyxa sp. WMMC2535 TaxID=2712867 RepID=UPI0015537836|nr:fused MFS/spermidine synthase [Pseudenhygromyxa sp. WMMC2535]